MRLAPKVSLGMTLIEDAHGRFGFTPTSTSSRFTKTGWAYEGRCELVQCPDGACSGQQLEIWRKPMGTRRSTYRYWGILCLTCEIVFELRPFDAASKKTLRDYFAPQLSTSVTRSTSETKTLRCTNPRCRHKTPEILAIQRSRSGLGCAGCDRPFDGVIVREMRGHGAQSEPRDSPWSIDLSERDLRDIDLSMENLVGANLTETVLRGTTLDGADLTGAKLTRVDLTQVSARRTILSKANLTGAVLRDSDLSEADLTRARMWATDLTGANAVGADLTKAFLEHAVLRGTDLSGATLVGAVLKRTMLSGTKLYGADLTDADVAEAVFHWAFADESTIWPRGFDPTTAKVIFK